MSDFFRGYVTGILVYMVVLLAVPMCSSAKADSPTRTQIYRSLIAHEAVSQGLDPAVALAVAEIESNFNPNAIGRAGERGVFQLHPKFHSKFDVDAGVKTLLYWQKHCPTKKDMTYVLCFNRGTRPVVNPKTAPYYIKFIRQYKKHNPPTTSPVALGRGFPSLVAGDE
jgi:hypothetical protein